MFNILIPTDFTQASLKLTEQAVRFLNREINITLFHAFEEPSPHDLLRSEAAPYRQLLTDDFRQACKQLKERYPSLINKIHFRPMTGSTNALFRNFADANQIDLIVCPESFVYRKSCSTSMNPIPFFRKSRIPMLQHFTLQRPVTQHPAPSTEMAFVHA